MLHWIDDDPETAGPLIDSTFRGSPRGCLSSKPVGFFLFSSHISPRIYSRIYAGGVRVCVCVVVVVCRLRVVYFPFLLLAVLLIYNTPSA